MGLGDFISGIFGSTNEFEAKAPELDKSAYQYGGTAGGADEAAGRYRGWADNAQNRLASQAQYGGADQSQANWDRAQAGNARQGQQTIADAMGRRALGQTPSIAGMQAAEDSRRLQQGATDQMQRAQAAQMSASASARGPQAMALAQQNAANNVANAHGTIGRETAIAQQNISNQAQINAANERMQAEQAAMGGYSGIRGGDQSSEGLAAQRAQFDANLGANREQFNIAQQNQQRQANDQYQLGMTNAEMGVRNAQMTGGMNYGAQSSANQMGAQNINAGVAGQNAQTNQQNSMGLISTAASVAGMVSDARSKKQYDFRADGGPVTPGKPTVVGERGPEVIVPQRDGVVIPNHGDQPGVVWGDDGRAYANTEAGLAPLTEKPRTMGGFRRDDASDQARVKRSEQDKWSREADAMMAGYKRSLGQGASVARDEGEIDQPSAGPAQFLVDYMRQQGEPEGGSLRLAMRAGGGPVAAGQPYLVGERGPEVVSTWGTGPAISREQVAQQQFRNMNEANLTEAGDRDAAARAPFSGGMAVPGFSPGMRMSAAEPLERADRETVGLAKAKEAEGLELTEEEERKAGGAQHRLKGSQKAQKPGGFSGAMTGLGDSMGRTAASVDTGYHPGSAYVPPQLLPVRAAGGPVSAGTPYVVGEGKGPEVMVPMQQISGPSSGGSPKGAFGQALGSGGGFGSGDSGGGAGSRVNMTAAMGGIMGKTGAPALSDDRSKLQKAFSDGMNHAQRVQDTGEVPEFPTYLRASKGAASSGAKQLETSNLGAITTRQMLPEGVIDARRDRSKPIALTDTPLAGAARAQEGGPYAYKPEYTPPGEQPGTIHVGPRSAQQMARDPVASTTVVQRPDGMLALDQTKMTKLNGAINADQQKQIDGIGSMLAQLYRRVR